MKAKQQAKGVLKKIAGDDILNHKFKISSNSSNYRTPITEDSIKNVSRLKIKEFNDNQNSLIFESRKHLLETLKNYDVGLEGSVVINLSDEKAGRILIGNIGVTKIENLSVPYYAIHNHPDNGVLSPGDLVGLLNRPMMFGIEALGNNGETIFAITKTFNSNVDGYFEYIHKELDGFKLTNSILDAYKNYELIKDFSEKLLEKGAEYGFKIIR